MAHRIAAVALCALALLASKQANAWFFFWIPTGAIVRALETKPDEITVSYQDRSLGKCGGYHFNQAYKYSDTWGNPDAFVAGGNSAPAVEESAESKFHKAMAERSVEKSSEQGKVKNLAEAYSTAWGRAAEGGFDANRAYGRDLAGACVENGIAVNLASSKAQEAANERLQADEHTKRRNAEYERNRQAWEEKERRQKAEESARLTEQAKNVARTTSRIASRSSSEIDFSAEAKKSARILGCSATDLRVTGTDGRNILFVAQCQEGGSLALSCDPLGLCLRANSGGRASENRKLTTAPTDFKFGLAPKLDVSSQQWGYMNPAGRWVIEPVFGGAKSFDSGGWAAVAVGSGKQLKWGYINAQAEWVVPPQFSELEDFDVATKGFARVRVGSKSFGEWKYLSRNGDLSNVPAK